MKDKKTIQGLGQEIAEKCTPGRLARVATCAVVLEVLEVTAKYIFGLAKKGA